MNTDHRSAFYKLLLLVLSICWLTGCTIQPIQPATPTASPATLSSAIATLLATTTPQVEEILRSPDGQWRAEVLVYACTEIADEGEVRYEQLLLIEAATNEQVAITQQQINCGGLGAFGLAALCWSADSQTLYFTDAREGTPDGNSGEWQRPIWQFTRSNGEIEPYTGALQAGATTLALPVACG